MSLSVPESPQTAKPHKQLRIVHLDDMRELCTIVQVSLERDGHKVESFNDGLAALRRIEANPQTVDLFITDHHMPKLNGLEVVRHLRRISFPGRIFIYSSEIDDDVNAEYRRLHADRVMSKPILLPELRTLLAEF
ncbi:MAG TPA: response regulator [Candidatus Didemnitutus sp.]|nr:response regulator [Candidatus Didemnitutus sp.]